ncbi:hypothetical protein F7984_10295 [Pradoshia sp. D12]|uniref:SEC-C metal-binding domain-containing protein n=1 Tax=Bacillaceae TaxID=186817 RepID=UPI00111E5AEF|nr:MULTISPECIES: SEC-C metal-binding domain-containing protein [Bacillaceae]QFK71593.1 hypothetical protein F7984_10295 [Pradoshia sp. D12]TPF73388.1 hypothetical protein FHY44_06690 [Bacillus sp. D12]
MTTATVDEYNLESLLDSLKMDALKNIRRNLNLKNMSSLRKKELVAALAEKIPASVPEKVQMMDLHQYTAIVAMMTKSGIMPIEQIGLENVFYLSSIGYIHPSKVEDQPVVVMPTEVMKQFYNLNPKEIMTVINRNQKVTNILFGLIRYYGFIEVEKAHKLIEGYIQEEVDIEWLHNYIRYLEDFYGDFRLDDEYIIHDTIKELDGFKQAQASRVGLKYYHIPAETMVNVNRYEPFERTEQMVEFIHYLSDTYSLKQEEAAELADRFIFKVQFGESLPDVVKWFGEQIEFESEKDINALVEKMVTVVNNTRLWILKGHTPSELSSPSASKPAASAPVLKTQPKVGRNEPCPCGSGKKYKKCCGKA